MSAREFEVFLARIYVDSSARAAFKANPRCEALRAGLSEEECAALANLDWSALELATRSYTKKRQSRLERKESRSIRKRCFTFLRDLPKRVWFLSWL